MPDSKLSTYTARTNDYMKTLEGRCQYQGALAFYGRTDRALCVIVMRATGLRLIERITEVVDALLGKVAA